MTKLDLENIKSQVSNLKNLPNNILISNMDILNKEFELTKSKIIELTYHLDKIEELYELMIKEHQTRG
jgi:hypothetical protein